VSKSGSKGTVVDWEGALRLDRRVEDLSIKLTRHRRDERSGVQDLE